MNKPAKPSGIREWIDPPSVDEPAAPGYEAWLKQDIEAGLADLKAGRVVSRESIRKEFGLE